MNIDLSNIAFQVYNMRRENQQRLILHSKDSTLNLMIVRINTDIKNELPHKNIGRDEYFSVVEGAVLFKKFADNGSTIVHEEKIQKSPFYLTHIPADVFHTISTISSEAYLLEIIGGKFMNGSTTYLNM